MGKGGRGLTRLMISQRAAWNINSSDLLSSPRTTPAAPMAPASNNLTEGTERGMERKKKKKTREWIYEKGRRDRFKNENSKVPTH